MTKFGDLLKKHREEQEKTRQVTEQSEEISEIAVEDVPQELPPVVAPLPRRLIFPKAMPKPQPISDKEELSPEDIDLMVQNLAQDEDIVLYLKALRGESKYNMLLKLQSYSNPRN